MDSDNLLKTLAVIACAILLAAFLALILLGHSWIQTATLNP